MRIFNITNALFAGFTKMNAFLFFIRKKDELIQINILPRGPCFPRMLLQNPPQAAKRGNMGLNGRPFEKMTGKRGFEGKS